MKLRYRISIWVALALAGSLLWGGSVWLWLAGICAGKFLFRLLLTIVLAIAVYILTYALIIGAIVIILFFLLKIYRRTDLEDLASTYCYYSVLFTKIVSPLSSMFLISLPPLCILQKLISSPCTSIIFNLPT